MAETQGKTQQKQAAGATKPTSAEVKGKIVEFAWHLKKEGFQDTTIKQYVTVVKTLVNKGADIFDAESVKDLIAKQHWSGARKHVVVAAYTSFLKLLGKTWTKPMYHVTRKLPFIPTEQEIDTLIAGCGKKTATFLQLLKETAMRSGEANRLEWSDIDLERKTITLNNPEKNSKPRIFKVSSELIAMLNSLPKTSSRVFGGGPGRNRKSVFYKSRKVIARKLQNPRLLKIKFHTLRHWKATMLYHQTKDILYVKEFLGHKRIDATLLYIQLAGVIFQETTDEFICKVAGTVEEASGLIETGFEYVCEINGVKLFRKRK